MEHNPPAFPIPGVTMLDGIGYPTAPGMTLRDWFAGQALAGICAGLTGQPTMNDEHLRRSAKNMLSFLTAAEDAYDIADAMLEARKGGAA